MQNKIEEVKDIQPFTLLSQFLRGCSHELRTPLSVISNELYVLSNENTDVRLALEKLKDITNILNTFQSLIAAEEQEEVSLEDLLQPAIEATGVALNGDSAGTWTIARVQGQKVLQELIKILLENAPSEEFQITIDGDSISFCPLDDLLESTESHTLLSNLLPSRHQESALLTLIDTIFLFHGIVCEKQGSDTLRLIQRK